MRAPRLRAFASFLRRAARRPALRGPENGPENGADAAGSTNDGGVHALLNPELALRARFVSFRRALDANDRAAMERELGEFERGLHRRIEQQLRLLQPALARVALPGRDARRELEMQYVQLRELTRNLALRVMSQAARAEALGFADNLDRRLSAHEAELERVYYPAAWPALSAADREALARVDPGRAS